MLVIGFLAGWHRRAGDEQRSRHAHQHPGRHRRLVRRRHAGRPARRRTSSGFLGNLVVAASSGAIRRSCGCSAARPSTRAQTEDQSDGHCPRHDSTAAAAPSRKGASARPGGAAQAGLDPRQGAGLRAAIAETREIVQVAQAGHRLRRGRLPQHRRVLGQEARHLHDHGRDLHARLRLLQCRHRHPDRARSATSRSSVARCGQAKMGLSHVVITSVDRDDLADGGAAAFRRGHPRHPRGARRRRRSRS